jgi:Cd2+/Zn2+-exporting ATPase
MSIVFVARDHQVLGWIGLRDAIRPVAGEAVRQLRELGVRQCAMITGDNEAVARTVGGRIDVAEIKAGCLPEEKAAYVRELRAAGVLVAVVGDGVNDAPALAAGDIGIAMGAIGSDVAIQSASVALMNNDLRRIPFFIALARKARLFMNQNLAMGLGFILLGLYFSTVGIVTPVVAAVLHSTSSLIIIFNSARLVRAGEELQSSDAAG